jgi:acetylornithine deacetylase/succinyl-diaminopimelate desuccinylase-like protein
VPAATDARRHLSIIARAPRPAGSAAEDEARQHCAAFLRAHGFMVREETVSYSALPGRYATPLLGGGMGIAIVIASLAASRGSGVVALTLLVGALLVVAVAGRWLAREGVLALPLMRERSRNLVGVRGTPRVWLMAHLDSKSQPIPIALRAAGLISLGLVWLAAAVLGIAEIAGVNVASYGPYLAAATVAAAIPVVSSVVGSSSDGARDNASGVATVLCAVELLPPDMPAGIVFTSAEELGLAGARAWAREEGRKPGTAINVDTVDDRGDLSVMFTGRSPDGLVRALTRVAQRRSWRIVVRRLVPGILTDAVALADAGWSTVTVSRAGMSTLTRVHTAADTAAGMSAVGISETAALVADALQSFTAHKE